MGGYYIECFTGYSPEGLDEIPYGNEDLPVDLIFSMFCYADFRQYGMGEPGIKIKPGKAEINHNKEQADKHARSKQAGLFQVHISNYQGE